MVTAGEGPSSAPSSAYEAGGGGVGGKFRKRPFRKTQTTPYDRPPTSLRNPSWFSKLVMDPASKILASSAQRFFDSVFRKRLPPPPPPPPELNQDLSDRHRHTVLKKQAEARDGAIGDNENLTHNLDGGGISELEQLLKQKTFTRSEIDRLTELLHSRAVDLPVVDDVKMTEENISKPAANFERQQQFLRSPLEEKRTGSDRSHGLISTPAISARVLQEDIASPAEIAKAYMGNQASKVSPSMLGLHSRVIREDAGLRSNVPFTPKSTLISMATKSSGRVEVPENGFMTPRSRGRSAIYNMARTPYSRVHPTAFEKGSGSRKYGYGGSLLQVSSLKEPDGELGSRQVALKRRSSVLDDDLGSVGPIRRIRQKPNMLSHKLFLPRGIEGVSDAVQRPSSLTQKFPSSDEWRHEVSKVIRENDDNHTTRTSYAHVPPKSSEMAARILEHLEKMTPKEKSAESKLIAAREKSPAKLTTDMLHGQALKSLEDADSSKLLQNNQDGHSDLVSGHTSAPRKQDEIEENGLQKFDSQQDISTPVGNSDITAPVKGVLASIEVSDSVAKSVAQHPQKKRAFMMSAHEDYLELDEDLNFSGSASEVLPEARANPEISVTNQNSASTEKVLFDKTPSSPEIKTAPEPLFSKRTDLEVGNATNVGRENAGVTAPTSLASTITSELVALPPSVTSENPKQAIDKVSAVENSSWLSGEKPFSWAHSKPAISSSSNGISAGVTDAPSRVPACEKCNDSNSQEATEINGKVCTSQPLAFSSTASGGLSSNVPKSSNNGPLSISPFTFSSPPAPAATGFADQFTTSSISNLASSSTISSATATSSSPVGSTSVPSLPVVPIFKFGSSIDPSTSASSASIVETPVLKAKTEKEANMGSSSNSPFGSTSFASVGSGRSSSFGLNSTITSSTANGQSQGSLSSTGSGSLFSSQSLVVGSGDASITQGMPFQFGSSAASQTFGTSGVAPFTSSNTLFSSSTTTTKVFGTGSGFGLTSSASLSETKSVIPGSAATSSILSLGVNASSSSSSETNAISSNGGSAPATFSFGVSSLAPTLATNTNSSSSGATPIFSFGVSSSSSGNNVMESSSGGSSGIFGISPVSSSTETNPASSSSATPSIFGSNLQASKSSPFSSTFNSSPATGFSFGIGSSSFASSSTASMVFGSSTGALSGPVFSFTTASATTTSSPSPFGSQPIFGNPTSAFTGSNGNNYLMNSEDSMAEDPVQSSMPAVPVFGQQPVSPSPGGFMFGSTVQSQTATFQFGGQQNPAASQNPSPFQASGSLEFSAGGSFSLGSGGVGGDKSGRKIVKVNRNRNRKK